MTTTPAGWHDPDPTGTPAGNSRRRRRWTMPLFALGVVGLVAGSAVLNAYVGNQTRPAINRDASVEPIMAVIGEYEYPCLRFTDDSGGARGGLWCDATRARLLTTPVPKPSTD